MTENYFHYRVNEALTERANQFGLILDDISITHLTFGREFTHAVELKQVAQQEAEKAKFLVEKAEQIKQANIISAEGDTKAAELLATCRDARHLCYWIVVKTPFVITNISPVVNYYIYN